MAMKKYLDIDGLQYLWSRINMQDYPNNEMLIAIINAIDEEKANKDDIPVIDESFLVTTEPKDDDVPKVFIDGVIPTTKDDVLAELTYISKTTTFHAYITIKCQGNSSMSYPKKNFTIKLYEDAERTIKKKAKFKNWSNQYKFCLKANWIDISHLRNIISARLWADVVKSRPDYENLPELLRTSPNQGAIDGFPIKVYANGVYQGRYTWNIPKDGWMTNMDDDLDTHSILCGENYESGCFRALPVIDESDWSDELHGTPPALIKTSWTNAVNFVMTSTDDEFKANIGNYFDLQSLLDYHIFGIYACCIDQYGKNQIYMTYDGNKWFASMYDLDSTWGLYWNGQTMLNYNYDRGQYEDLVQGRAGNLLYERLEDLFFDELQARWIELRSSALSLSNVINRFERMSDIVSNDLIKEDYASTTAFGQYTAIPSVAKNNIQQIRNFAVDRRDWTDEYFGGLTNETPEEERIPCTGISKETFAMYFDETSEGTQRVPVSFTPANTTDKPTWKSNDESIITVRQGYATAVGIGNTTITITCGDITTNMYVYVTYLHEEVNTQEIIYQLPAATTFNGNNYIDTGIAPLAEDTPFTVFLDWTDTNESEFVASKHVIMHCMNEYSPYPGLILQYGPTGVVSEYKQGTNSISSSSSGADIANADLENVKVVFRKDENGLITIARVYNENGLIHKNEKTMDYVAVGEALRLGCYRSNTGGTGRFAKGILNDCKIYNYAISDDEMNELLLTATPVLPQAEEIYLRRNYSPNNAKWTDVVTDFNFDRGDYIEINVNVSGCSAANENIISIGDTITSWNQYTGGYHSYYTRSSNDFEANSLLPTGQEGRQSINPADPSNVTILVNKNGFHVNGTKLVENSRIGELSRLEIGSQEGNGRSKATYEYIKVVKYPTATASLDE
jgi:hypothetical protein